MGQKLVEEFNCAFIDYNALLIMQLQAESEKCSSLSWHCLGGQALKGKMQLRDR